MKIHSLPADIHAPEWEDSLVDGRFSIDKDDQVNEAFFAELKAWLISHGYTKSLTGEIVRYPRGDGYAAYMVAEGKTTFLVHLPIGDAWDLPEWQTRGLRKIDIVEQIEGAKRLNALFAKKS